MNGKKWTKEEIGILDECYKQGLSISQIALKLPGRTINAISAKAEKEGFAKYLVKNNNPNYKREYQEYDWCYKRYIEQGKSYKEMAKEANCTVRVIEKWCSEIHEINNKTFKKLKKISNIQKDIIIGGILGDGHITPSDTKPLYIESHAETEKDYLFWKYKILKDMCLSEPKYYPLKRMKIINGESCVQKSQYRLSTRCVYDLKNIRDKNTIDIIKDLNELQLSCHILDDGYRTKSNWEICVASFSQNEIDVYIETLKAKFGIACKQKKDKRYCVFDSKSSLKLDKIIIDNIPCELDIITKKIIKKKVFCCAEKTDLSKIIELMNLDIYNSILLFNKIREESGRVYLDVFLNRIGDNKCII